MKVKISGHWFDSEETPIILAFKDFSTLVNVIKNLTLAAKLFPGNGPNQVKVYGEFPETLSPFQVDDLLNKSLKEAETLYKNAPTKLPGKTG